MLFRFMPASENELARSRATGFASPVELRVYAFLNLVWSAFILTTPWFSGGAFPNWFWPTMASFAVFLWLYFRALYRRDSDVLLYYALAIAARLGLEGFECAAPDGSGRQLIRPAGEDLFR